ncbi:hypothetical protein NGRA_3252, partial [Nosema granulosis]
MNWILLIVLDIFMCSCTSSTSSYIINTSDSGNNEGLNILELRTPVDESLCFIPQYPSDCSSNYPNVLNNHQHDIYNLQDCSIFNPQYGTTYNYSQDQNNFTPQYGTNNNSPQIEDSITHNNLFLKLLNEDQRSGENEVDITNIIDLLEFEDYHQASNSIAHNNLLFESFNEDQKSVENEAYIPNILDLLEFDDYQQASNLNAHNNTQFTFSNEADDSSIIDVVGIDDQKQASLSKKKSEPFKVKKRKLTDEIITNPDGIKKQRNVKKYPNPINSVCNGLNYKKYNRTKTLKDNSFLKMIENYNLQILSHQINIDLKRFSNNVDEITNTTNIQTDDKAIYEEVFKRIVETVNLLFLSKVNEKRQNTQNVIVSEPKTPFDIFDDDINFLRKEILELKQDKNIITSGKIEILELKQDEKIIPSGEIAILESKLKHSLANPRICFYDYLKKVALLIYNNNNFDVTIIIKNLLYEIRTLKYEIREMRSVILTIIYYNNLDIKDAREFLDLFICRM